MNLGLSWRNPLAIVAAFALLLCSACKKREFTIGSVNTWTIDGTEYGIDTPVYRTYPTNVYQYEYVAPGTRDTIGFHVEFLRPLALREMRLLSYKAEYLGKGVVRPESFHLRVRYQGKFYRNYEPSFTAARVIMVDTVENGIVSKYEALEIGTLNLQQADDITQEIQVAARLKLSDLQPMDQGSTITLGGKVYKGINKLASYSCNYSVLFSSPDTTRLYLTFAAQPVPGQTLRTGTVNCESTGIVDIQVSKPSGQYYRASAIPLQPTSIKLTESDGMTVLMLENLPVKAWNGEQALMSRAVLHFKTF